MKKHIYKKTSAVKKICFGQLGEKILMNEYQNNIMSSMKNFKCSKQLDVIIWKKLYIFGTLYV